MIPDYEGMSIEELEAEAKRKELILKNMRLDRQLGNNNSIYRLLQKRKIITIADVKRNIRSFRNADTTFVQNAMMELVESGKARVVPSHKGLRITAVLF